MPAQSKANILRGTLAQIFRGIPQRGGLART